MRVFLTGASGQLGAALRHAFEGNRDVAVAPSHAQLDVSDHADVHQQVAGAQSDVVVNCAAFNGDDGGEDRRGEAFASSAIAVRSLARAGEGARATLVHDSTDFVCDGTASAPYGEDGEAAPQSRYSASKLLGE